MDSTTHMLVEQIKARGWYSTSQTLGEGGWPAVHNFAGTWKVYEVYLEEHKQIIGAEIIARDDSAAAAYIAETYIPGTRYELYERQTTRRLVTTTLEE